MGIDRTVSQQLSLAAGNDARATGSGTTMMPIIYPYNDDTLPGHEKSSFNIAIESGSNNFNDGSDNLRKSIVDTFILALSIVSVL